MCDAATAGIIISAVSAAGAAYQYRQTGKYNKALYAQQEQYGKEAAKDALARGRQREGAVRERAARVASAQRAVLAAGGADIGSGSALDILSGTAWMGEFDAQTEYSNARREAWAARVGAQNAQAAGALASSEARYGMYGSLLSGAGTAYSQYSTAKASGVWGQPNNFPIDELWQYQAQRAFMLQQNWDY